MAEVVITGTITTTDILDVYATHDAIYGKGGLRTVADITERNAITQERRVIGMLVYVESNDTYYRLLAGPWSFTSLDWQLFATGTNPITDDWDLLTSGDLQANANVVGAILPSADDITDLGSDLLRFRDLYLGSRIDFLTDLEFNTSGINIFDANSDGIKLKTLKGLSIESNSPSYPVIDSESWTEGPVQLYAYYLKIGPRLFVSDYFGNINEYDEDLNLINSYDSVTYFPDGGFAMQYNSILDRIYVGDFGGTDTRYIDLNSPETVVTVATGHTGQRDVITYNSINNRIYATDYSGGFLDNYDSDYQFISATALPGGFSGFGITSNQLNGKIYLTGNDGVDDNILIYEDTTGGLNLLNTVIKSGSAFNVNGSFGGDFDPDRNRIYVAASNNLVIIDGNTDLEITSIDLTSYGGSFITSIKYESDKIIVTNGVGGTSYLLSIDADTYTVTVIATGTQSYFSYAILDNGFYYFTINDNLIEKISDTPTYSIGSILNTTLTADRTHTLQDADGILAHVGDDLQTLSVSSSNLTISSGNTVEIYRKVNNSLYVDKLYGVNATAEVDNPNKPYLTYAAARAAAVSGDTIILRPGTYTESPILKTGVNVYAYPGVLISGQVIDSGVPVTMKWMGYADVTFSGNSPVFISGGGSNVDMQFRDINAAGVGIGISVDPGVTATFLNLRCRNLIGTSFNYSITLRGGANANIVVEDSIRSSTTTSPTLSYITVFCRSAYSGTSFIKANRVIIGNTTFIGGGMLYSDATTNLSTSKIYMEFNTVESQFTTTGFDEFTSTIMKYGPGLANIKIGEMTTISKPCIVTTNTLSTSTLVFEGKASCEQREVVRIANGTGKNIFKNCVFKRNNTGSDGNRVVIVGNPTGAPSLFISASDFINTEFINTKIIKNSSGTAADELVMIDGSSSITLLKDCEIIGIGTAIGSSACNADTLAEGNIYFKNTNSNLDNTVNITDTSVVSGFIGNDTNLTTFEI